MAKNPNQINICYSPQHKVPHKNFSRASIQTESAGLRFSMKTPLDYNQEFKKASILMSPGNNHSEFAYALQKNMKMEESAQIRNRTMSRMKNINLDELSQEQLLEFAITILAKSPEFRNNQDIRMLERTTKNVEFFQNYDKETHEHICRYMTTLSCPQSQTLFEIGSHGETFYIILKGSVDVWIFLPKVVEETKPDGTIESRTEMTLTHVRTLFAGSSFGELALMENKPRAATITCREKCHFGVLDKTSFDNILKEKEKRKLYEKIDFFASMKLFGKWSYNAVKLLYYQTELLDCIRNQHVLKEGQEPLGIYMVKSGEFKLVAKIQIKFSDEEQEQYALSRGVLQDYYKTVELCVLNTGEVIGEEEVIVGTQQQFSLYCTSNKGSLFFWNKKEFFRRVWSDENSRTFLQKTIKFKKTWREARIAEIVTMEKNKVFSKTSTKKSTFLPKKISTHLLYKRLSELRKARDTNENFNPKESILSELSQDNLNMSHRITNKLEKENQIYASFKLQTVKKLEKWEKFQEAKEKMNLSSTSLSQTSKGFLHKLVKGSDIPMKLMRDTGAFNSKIKSQSLSKKKKSSISKEKKPTFTENKNQSTKNTQQIITPFDACFTKVNYVKVEPFSSIKPEKCQQIRSEAFRQRIYSEEQKIEIERRLIHSPISCFFDNKATSERSKISLNETLSKFKKNIRNIFVTTAGSESTGKRRKGDRRIETESFEFINVCSKTIYPKLI